MEGYIKIHRKIIDSSIYFNSQAVHLFLHLLLKANHKPTKIMFNSEIVNLKIGQFITGRKKLAEETNINESKIYRLLEIFENEKLIEQQTNSRYSIITIINWIEYQQSEQQMNSKRTATEQRLNTDKNDKNDKNEKNILGEFKNIFLLEDEINKLKLVYGNKFNDAIEMLSSYIASTGKKYKSHYAVLGQHNWVYKKIISRNNNIINKESGYYL